MNIEFLEQYYETVVLPLYGDAVNVANITWKDHGKVGADAWAHYFDGDDGREYVLLYEDFPGSDYLNDGLTHGIVQCGDEDSLRIASTPDKTVENILGYFTLYIEQNSR